MISTAEAAQRLARRLGHMSERRVRKLCECGLLKAERLGDRAWMVDEASVDTYMPRPPGRPKQ